MKRTWRPACFGEEQFGGNRGSDDDPLWSPVFIVWWLRDSRYLQWMGFTILCSFGLLRCGGIGSYDGHYWFLCLSWTPEYPK